jgi:hypothetical protein
MIPLMCIRVGLSVGTFALLTISSVHANAEDDAVPTPGPDLAIPSWHAVGLFAAMRGTEAYLWPDPFAFTEIDQWPRRYGEAFTKPPVFDTTRPAFEWDGDRWTTNVIGHGLLGSELYLRARTCHLGWAGSLLFAAAASTTWEYVFEANGVRPSGQDLWYTPLSGLVIGEARFQAWRAAEGIASPALRTGLRILLDPLGEFERRAIGCGC